MVSGSAFGGFVNGAQSWIDQILHPAEVKWGRHANGITQCRPHGYEGRAGALVCPPLERFQAARGRQTTCRSCSPSSAEQIFHVAAPEMVSMFRSADHQDAKSLLRANGKTRPRPRPEFTKGDSAL